MLFGGITLVLVLLLGGIMSAYGASREFKEVLIAWGLGLLGVVAIVAIGILLTAWSGWAGLLFMLVGGLYVIDRMLKS